MGPFEVASTPMASLYANRLKSSHSCCPPAECQQGNQLPTISPLHPDPISTYNTISPPHTNRISNLKDRETPPLQASNMCDAASRLSSCLRSERQCRLGVEQAGTSWAARCEDAALERVLLVDYSEKPSSAHLCSGGRMSTSRM